MNKLLFILLLFPVLLFSQKYKDTLEVVTIQPPQKFLLNSGSRSFVGGISRTFLQVALPENTVSWYYSVVTVNSKSKENEKEADNVASKIQLTSKLMSLVGKVAKTAANFNPASIAINLLSTPSGGEICDVYLLDEENKRKFMAKEDQILGGKKPFDHEAEGFRPQFNSGTVIINSIKTGTWYIGLKNPSATAGMYVTIEIAAITKKKVKIEVNTEVAEGSSKANSYRTLAEEEFNNGNYSKSIEYSKKILELFPKSPIAHFRIGNCNILLNKSSDALDNYITGISLTSNNPEAVKMLNNALNQLNRIQSQNPNVQGFEDIKKLLQNEVKRRQGVR
jgi:tetratricopeptide (TPR) repeat protein